MGRRKAGGERARRAGKAGAPGKRAGYVRLTDRTFVVKVELLGIAPSIWRRFTVPGCIRLSALHEVLQAVMGWEGYHLHEFRIGTDSYGPLDEECPRELKDEHDATLAKVAPAKGTVLFYDYDFGDGWEHGATVEDVLPPPLEKGPAGMVPRCLGGARACPPEDCGGVGGYEEMLRVLDGRSDPDDREELLEWAGDYDPEEFDVGTVNKMLRERFGSPGRAAGHGTHER